MKKNVIKMTVAAVCVVTVGVVGMKAYNVANQSEANNLLEENVEALSAGDCGRSGGDCVGPMAQCIKIPGGEQNMEARW